MAQPRPSSRADTAAIVSSGRRRIIEIRIAGSGPPAAPRTAATGGGGKSGRSCAPARRNSRATASEGVADEAGAQHHGRRQVEPAAHAEDEGQQGGGEQHQRVEQHLQPRELVAVRDRQHRQAGLAVVLDAVQRQRPEVRRRPQEDDQAQHQRLGADVARASRPSPAPAASRPRRRRSRCSAACSGFEHHGVDDRVADEGGEGQPHGQRVHQHVQQRRCPRRTARPRTAASACR